MTASSGLRPGCPRCPAPLGGGPGAWTCPDHGSVPPAWRPAEAGYDALTAHLEIAGPFPTYLPWPLGPDWQVTDHAVVAEEPGRAVATLTACSGPSRLDGPVDVLVVSEEPGTGLGARCAGLAEGDLRDVVEGPALARLRIETTTVPVWAVSTADLDEELDRSVAVGEAGGRWLWLVLRPASAVLLLTDEWILRDVSDMGPPLVELPFGGPPPGW